MNAEFLFTSQDRTITIWDKQTFTEIGTLKMPWFSQISSLQIDGSFLLATSHRESNYTIENSFSSHNYIRNVHKESLNLKIWKIGEPWELVASKKIPNAQGYFISDEEHYYYKEPQSFIQILSQEDYKNVGYLPGSTAYCAKILFDAEYIYGLYPDSLKKTACIKIWQKATFQLIDTINLEYNDSCSIDQDENYLFVGTNNHFQIYDKKVWVLSHRIEFASDISGLCVVGNECYVGTKSKEIFKVEKESWKIEKKISNNEYSCDLMLKDAQYLITTGKYDNHITLWK